MSPEPSQPYEDWYPSATPAPAPYPGQKGRGGLNSGQWVAPDRSPGGPNDPLYQIPFASGFRRLVAGAIDLVATIIAPLVIVGEIITHDGSPGQIQPILLAMAFAVGINSFALTTSVGKKAMGIQAVRLIRHREGEGFARVGAWRTLVRLFFHLFEVPTFLYLAAFGTRYGQTFSDAGTHIVHVRVPGGPDMGLLRAPWDAADLV